VSCVDACPRQGPQATVLTLLGPKLVYGAVGGEAADPRSEAATAPPRPDAAIGSQQGLVGYVLGLLDAPPVPCGQWRRQSDGSGARVRHARSRRPAGNDAQAHGPAQGQTRSPRPKHKHPYQDLVVVRDHPRRRSSLDGRRCVSAARDIAVLDSRHATNDLRTSGAARRTAKTEHSRARWPARLEDRGTYAVPRGTLFLSLRDGPAAIRIAWLSFRTRSGQGHV
jgi:hypothetical protein